jgi:peptidoglycan/LPS O-acetylase OafA/YrhL
MQGSIMGTTKTRLDHIDSLRGLAALSVVIQHIFGYLHKADLASAGLFPELQFAMFEGLDLGRYGVVLFFLVSGFIIPFSLNKNSSLAKFSISRFFRLYPAYWAAILLTVILSPWLSENVFSPVQIAYNLTMVPRLLGEDMINGIYWTLFVELVFYALCALLFKLGQLENTILIGLVALGFNLATTVPITLKYADVVHFPIQFLSLHLSFLFFGKSATAGACEKQYDGEAVQFALCGSQPVFDSP